MTDVITTQDQDYDDYEALSRLASVFGANAKAKGFTELHEKLKALAETVRHGGEVVILPDPELADYLIKVEAMSELMLVVTELGEAAEEIRTSPFPLNQNYYVDENGQKTLEPYNADGTLRKPEGLGSELADVQIRLGDTVTRRKIPLGEATWEKKTYNDTRARRHGGKAL